MVMSHASPLDVSSLENSILDCLFVMIGYSFGVSCFCGSAFDRLIAELSLILISLFPALHRQTARPTD